LRGKGKGKNAGRERAEREREEDQYIQHLPWQFQHAVDVKADGHCGFRVIAAQIYDTEEDWGASTTGSYSRNSSE